MDGVVELEKWNLKKSWWGKHTWECSMLISISCHLFRQVINTNYGCWACWGTTNINLNLCARMIVEGAFCHFQWNCDQHSPVIFTARTSVQPSTCPARPWVCLTWGACVRPTAAAASVRTRVSQWPSPWLMSWDTSTVSEHTHTHTLSTWKLSLHFYVTFLTNVGK